MTGTSFRSCTSVLSAFISLFQSQSHKHIANMVICGHGQWLEEKADLGVLQARVTCARLLASGKGMHGTQIEAPPWKQKLYKNRSLELLQAQVTAWAWHLKSGNVSKAQHLERVHLEVLRARLTACARLLASRSAWEAPSQASLLGGMWSPTHWPRFRPQ